MKKPLTLKSLQVIKDLPKLRTTTQPTIFQVLRFKTDFEVKMKNAVPNVEDHKKYLIEVVEGSTK